MTAQPMSLLLNRSDYLAAMVVTGLTPAGAPVVEWVVQDLTDLENREPFAHGVAVGLELAVTEAGQASRERMAAAATVLSCGHPSPVDALVDELVPCTACPTSTRHNESRTASWQVVPLRRVERCT